VPVAIQGEEAKKRLLPVIHFREGSRWPGVACELEPPFFLYPILYPKNAAYFSRNKSPQKAAPHAKVFSVLVIKQAGRFQVLCDQVLEAIDPFSNKRSTERIGKRNGVTRDQFHHTQGAPIEVQRKIKCHHNLATPTVLLLDPGWSA
jgi:hypothetical protein